MKKLKEVRKTNLIIGFAIGAPIIIPFISAVLVVALIGGIIMFLQDLCSPDWENQ